MHKTNRSESICKNVFIDQERKLEVRSRSERFGSDHKLCQVAIRRRFSEDSAGSFEETRSFRFRELWLQN